MDVIRHQAVRDNLDGILFRVIAKQPQVGCLISVAEKHALSMISPLRHVMRNARKQGACVAEA